MSGLFLAAGLLAALASPRLSAEVVVLSDVPLRGGHLRAKLVVRNAGLVPVRIGTLVGQSGGGGDGWREQTFHPDWFKSDAPSSERSAAAVVTLKPGEEWSVPIEYDGLRDTGGRIRIEAAFETGPGFATRHRTWAGRVEAKPDVVEVK